LREKAQLLRLAELWNRKGLFDIPVLAVVSQLWITQLIEAMSQISTAAASMRSGVTIAAGTVTAVVK
jgi:hypothetical protein